MRLIIGTLTAVGIGLAWPALAQGMQVTTIAPGIRIVDTAGAPVGIVEAVKGDNLQVKTDKHEVLLPKSSFTLGNGKLRFGLTQAQLDAQIEQSAAAASSAVVAGATVKSVDGIDIGKIDAVADGKVTIALNAGTKIQVDQNGVAGNADGTVTVGLTSAQLHAQVQPAPAAAPSGQ